MAPRRSNEPERDSEPAGPDASIEPTDARPDADPPSQRGDGTPVADYFTTAEAPPRVDRVAGDSASTEERDAPPNVVDGQAGSVVPPPDPVPSRRRRPGREWLSSGVVGVAVLLVLAVICAGLIVAVVVKTRNDAAIAAREAASYTPPPLDASAPAAGLVGSVAVIGDESAQRAATGVAAAQRWPRLLASAFGADLDVSATVGAGYAAEGASGRTFVDAAADVPADAGLVLFVGGAADEADTSLSLAQAATEAYSAATQQAPDATVIAVGPLYRPVGVTADDFDQVRTTLRSAARIAGVRWVDPVAADWLSGVDGTGDLSEADQRTIAERLQGLVGDDE